MMITHTHWWKELKASDRVTMYSSSISKDLNDPKALHWACWQAVGFWLPLVQQGAAGWWAPLPTIPMLQLRDIIPSTTSSDFQVMRQQRTMVLAQVLQTCANESGFPPGVLCDSAQELQKCMAPLLALSGDV